MARFWHYGEPKNGILHVRIEQADRSVNTLSRAAMEELAELIARIRDDSTIDGVLFFSGKPGHFIAGADVEELQKLAGPEEARELSHFGHTVFSDLAHLGVPTVALISGTCLGGGLEFALACEYRIADDDPKTLLGLPEVQLGLIPAWGGTVRLPQVIGLSPALPLILTGQKLNGNQARKKGLVDDVVPVEALQSVGETILKRQGQQDASATKNLLPRKPRRPVWQRWLEKNRLGQKVIFRQARRQVDHNTQGHYPAPQLALKAVERGVQTSSQSGFEAEEEAVAQLAEHPVTTELMRLFFLREEAKKPPQQLEDAEPVTIHRAGVVGAGAMGAGIALLMAQHNIWTRLKDLKAKDVAGGLQTMHSLLEKDVRRRRTTRLEASHTWDRISPTTEYTGFQHAEIIVEAVVENLAVKRQVFQDLARVTGPETVLATNTSSLRIEEIAREVPHPERVVGLHFFNPPHRMPLVEVVTTEQTSRQALATAVALADQLNKTRVLVGDCAGFLVNRLLGPYMNEAGYLLAEGAEPMPLEHAAREFGFPMGPLELTDLVGLDVAEHVSRNLHAAYGERMQPAPFWRRLHEMVRDEELGERTLIHHGWFGKRLNRQAAALAGRLAKERATGARSFSRQELVERLVYPIVNEAARCLQEGIVARPDDVDLAMVFGTGAAPFRGGILRYADSIGVDHIIRQLRDASQEHSHLQPSQALQQVAERGGFAASSQSPQPAVEV